VNCGVLGGADGDAACASETPWPKPRCRAGEDERLRVRAEESGNCFARLFQRPACSAAGGVDAGRVGPFAGREPRCPVRHRGRRGWRQRRRCGPIEVGGVHARIAIVENRELSPV
jgi:hypothetical protein